MAYSKARRLADIVVDTNGNVNVPTQSASDNDTSAASTAYVTTAVSGLIDSAPDTLNTLNEIAAALNDDANFNTTVTNAIAAKLPLAGGTMTGDLRVGTADAANRLITIAGGATGNAEGGEIRLEMAADHDGTYDFWRLDVNQDDFRIGRQGLTDLLVDSSGKVGIGTTSPKANLDVVRGGATGLSSVNARTTLLLQNNNSAGTVLSINAPNTGYSGIFLGDPEQEAQGQIKQVHTDNSMQFVTASGATEMTLKAGKLGIGTTSPGALLDLSGVTASSPPKFRLSGTGEASAGDTIGQIDFHSGDTTDNTAGIMASIKAIAGPSGGEGHLQFLTDMPSEGAAAASIALHLHANANVGINNVSPDEKLHISGGGIKVDGEATIASGSGTGVFLDYASNVGRITALDQGSAWRSLRLNAADIQFYIANGEQARIASDGETTINKNLRIANSGTATAGTVALEVLGQRSDTIEPANATAKFYGYSDGDGLAIGHYLSAPYGSYLQAGYLLDTYGTPYNNGYPITLNPKGGNVGIANSSPTSRLHLGDNSNSSTMDIGLQNSSRHYVIKTSGGDLIFKDESAGADRMVLESNGNLIVGASSGSAEGGKIQIFGAKSFVAQIPQGNMTITDTASMAAGVGGSINFAGAYLSNGTTTSFASIEASKADGTSGNYGGELKFKCRINGGQQDEFMRLTSNGTLHVDNNLGAHTGTYSFGHNTYNHAAVFGRNSTPDGTVVIEDYDVSSGIGNTVLKLFLRDQDPATNAKFITFGDGGGAVGSIIHNDDGGGVTYNTTSDYRLKENVEYNWDATTLLKQLKPAKFNFKRAPGRTVQGMLAHEVMNIVPYSVTGDKDHMMEIGTIKDKDDNVIYEEVYEHFCKTDEGQTWTKTGTKAYYQELDYSRLVPLLTKALQEQQTIIDDLKSRIETLEG